MANMNLLDGLVTLKSNNKLSFDKFAQTRFLEKINMSIIQQLSTGVLLLHTAGEGRRAAVMVDSRYFRLIVRQN
jgi:hypothetical protein